jgi:hypothetical protein
MDEILAAVRGVHARICVANLATYFRKDPSTIKRWVKAYNDGEGVARKVGPEIITNNKSTGFFCSDRQTPTPLSR